MAGFDWGKPTVVFGQPVGMLENLWLTVCESVLGATHLKIEVTGSWNAFAGQGQPCRADGIFAMALPHNLLLAADCSPGAAIGKIGGSSASTSDAKAFAIGRLTILAVPEKAVGPLFIGINGASLPVEIVEPLVVKVWQASPG